MCVYIYIYLYAHLAASLSSMSTKVKLWSWERVPATGSGQHLDCGVHDGWKRFPREVNKQLGCRASGYQY